MSDGQLARLSRRGNRQAFGLLARRWDGRLYGFLRRLLGDDEEARDACQEAFLRAFMNIGGLREPEHFRTWIHQIAVNVCRSKRRSARSRPEAPLDAGGTERVDALVRPALQPGPLMEAERADLAAILRKVLRRLPPEQRTAILLCEVQGFSSREIAKIVDAPATTVRSRIFYGLKALRRMLPEYGISEDYLGAGDGKR